MLPFAFCSQNSSLGFRSSLDMAANLSSKDLRALERFARGSRTKRKKSKVDLLLVAPSMSPKGVSKPEELIGKKRKAPERASGAASVSSLPTEGIILATEETEVLSALQSADLPSAEELAPSAEIEVMPVVESPVGCAEQERVSLPVVVAPLMQGDSEVAQELPDELPSRSNIEVEVATDAPGIASGSRSSEKGVRSGNVAAREPTPDEDFYQQEAQDIIGALKGEINSLRVSLTQERAARLDADFCWRREMQQNDLLALDLSVKDEVIQNLHRRSDWLETRLERAEAKNSELEKELSTIHRRVRYPEERRRHSGGYSRHGDYVCGRREHYERSSEERREVHLGAQRESGTDPEIEQLRKLLEECKARLDAREASTRLVDIAAGRTGADPN